MKFALNPFTICRPFGNYSDYCSNHLNGVGKCREYDSYFCSYHFKCNMASVYAFAIGTILLLLVLFVPFFRSLFEVSSLSIMQIMTVFGLALAPTVIIQIGKLKNPRI